jgi:alanyl-tRNA synthetase
MTGQEIRQGFLQYFRDRGHRVVASSSLVPVDDPTLLFTNAGMNQFKDVFLGREPRDYTRATTSQKCMRVSGKHNDLDTVGPSLRHHTFFEMLGNFSFGDYFKRDAIPFAWGLLTDVWKLDANRLLPSIFRGDDKIPRDAEAHDVWATLVPADRIHELGQADNFWQMGDTGPCGRCSEIYYFRGNEIPCDQPVCRGIECSCERYVEVWNNVFMEFERDEHGTLTPLPAPSIDTGMGLERITSVIQSKLSNYDTDLFTPILHAISDRAGQPYTGAAGPVDHPDVSMRVVADHLRAMTFLIADGVLPSNEWRGYVLRKIMRRAMRHGKKLGLAEPFLHDLVRVVTSEMGAAYPELVTHRDAVARTVLAEEQRFDSVLTAGLPKLEDLIADTIAARSTVLSGDAVFHLYDSLGVPFDFAEDLASQRGLAIDRAAYDRAMEEQRARARAGSTFEGRKEAGFAYQSEEAQGRIESLSDQFEGYDRIDLHDVPLVALFDAARHQTDRLDGNVDGYAVLERTPFYVEAGGQVSDTGWLLQDGQPVADVIGMTRVTHAGARAHRIHTHAPLQLKQRVTASVDPVARNATRRNHTATHLLHAALRRRLGTHVRQAGSLVAPDRLRFDYTHGQPLTADDRREIVRQVNEEIYRNVPVTTDDRRTEEALKSGAMAQFGEKYGDHYRVVSIPDFRV